MARILVALVAGLLFGLGLVVSQMVNPGKVLGFLDLLGDWDPSLAFVMAGAIPVAAIGYRLARASAAPFCAPAYAAPTQGRIDGSLVGGAILFGIGWGLVGYCPGPALAGLGLGNSGTHLFLAAMLAGMAGFSALQALAARRLGRA
ncbi:MAG: YeeE/YedE family protein [Proteobacteria bacterium]|nr:YeeE/YedE family protein [Pseudomonadota bacterium]MBI3498237.1 YeeE/YedE family protein [Pseudomonadota bacterium]